MTTRAGFISIVNVLAQFAPLQSESPHKGVIAVPYGSSLMRETVDFALQNARDRYRSFRAAKCDKESNRRAASVRCAPANSAAPRKIRLGALPGSSQRYSCERTNRALIYLEEQTIFAAKVLKDGTLWRYPARRWRHHRPAPHDTHAGAKMLRCRFRLRGCASPGAGTRRSTALR